MHSNDRRWGKSKNKKVHTEQLVWYNLFQLGQLFRASPHCCCSEFEVK